MTSVGTVISFPVPLYSNPPIEPQFYLPSRFVISNVTLGATTTVTTTVDHNYVIGQLVRLTIPPSFGCRQLNERTGIVLSIPLSTQMVLDIYSAGGDAFTASSAPTQPQTVAVGDYNSGVTNANGRVETGTFIPGSFINISPE